MMFPSESQAAEAENLSRLERVPWTIWTSVVATLSVVIGDVWDISWHISVGRDTFWTPPHMLIQLCAAIGGLSGLYLILSTTFGKDMRARDRSVSVFGLRGPLGAFVCGWGALAMVTSAPFDNWWHVTYGLDVKVISPPHAVLFMGAMAVILGCFLLIAAPLNGGSKTLTVRLDMVFVGLIGVLMLGAHADLIEFSSRVLMHSAIFYRCIAIAFVALLVQARGISRQRWACTTAAAIYTELALAQEWILPLFHAEQRLGPVYQRVPYMVPLGFPVLIIVPAILIDWLWPRIRELTGWTKALILGVVFLGAFLVVQWPFANFLMSARSGNWVFGTHYRIYMIPASQTGPPQFYPYERSAATWFLGMGIAFLCAILTSRLGLYIASWMRSVRR